MSLNYKEIDVILNELSLPGNFIQNIIQPSYDTIALYLYGADKAKTLLVCLAAGACRLHETRKKVPRSDTPLRFMEFMRSRIKGSKIVSAAQPGGNRIVVLELTKGAEQFTMYIRLWTGAANIIITDNQNRILDTFFRRPSKGEITGGTYTLPAETSQPQKEFEVRDIPGNGTFNEKIDTWYSEHCGTISREALLESARKKYNGQHSRLSNAIEHLEQKRASFLNADQWKHYGDIIMANLPLIHPGNTLLECTDYDTGLSVAIQLDAQSDGVKNAAQYYEKYKKALSGRKELEQDIASARKERANLEAQMASLEAEQNPIVIQQLLHRQNTPKQQQKKKYPGLTFRVDGWLLLVGRSAAENDELLRRHVRGSDIWLHVRDWHGSYVFVKAQNGKSVPLDMLLNAGTLALFYSKAREKASADIYYTPVKYLRRAKNGPKGLVLPTMEKNLHITLDDARLKKLETCRDER